ncbi:MAG: hypothetical protein RI978_472, partial [Verrucomicrobiota bacterium]
MTKARHGANVADLRSALGPLGWSAPLLDRFFKAREFDEFLARILASGRPDFFASAKIEGQLSASWDDGCLARIPRQGPVVVMANHPHGLADGVVAMDFLLRARPDALVVGNKWLAQIPGIRPWLIEVNPFDPDQADLGNLAGTRRILSHLKAGGCILTFPAGEVSNLSLKHRAVRDPVWSPQVVRLARRANASIVPLHISGGNSRLFHSLGLLHPKARTIMLLREFFSHRGKVIHLRTAKAVPSTQLTDHPDDEEATSLMRLRCELLSS